MLFPSGLSFITYTLAPKDLKAFTAALYAAPFAQSKATLNPFKSVFIVLNA